ncbi:putative membrane protein [Propionispora sp. 2/2-37]|uniref:CDP-diacylglycerol--serine O-phosphatidyltransferase n=1 Tax=Propionispora sp. 2/2-37 TaxID=1677858 RepID=UPI0006BB8B41|nr:CDP-diacylglycerol--serine O-phosphatidyltransferase [Propionispora sp. 2/2-37]CUH94243.1 putative membrane protein [Propionispora sp. 2/2-37]
MKSIIPNALTALNLVLGMFAIVSTLHGRFSNAAIFIVAAMIADGFDGRVARLFNVSSDFGRELDSLCDLVSFGVAPAVLAYTFLLHEMGYAGYFVAALFATCGALRLARFNINTGIVKGYFMGLPIPAAGCVVATFVLLGIKPATWLFAVMVILFAYLMVSTIKYPDFKGKGERVRILPAAITVAFALYLIFLTQGVTALLFIPFCSYAVFGILNTLFGLFDSRTI